jgi:hypothetical protein
VEIEAGENGKNVLCEGGVEGDGGKEKMAFLDGEG